jgi:hypothetical protein
MILWSVGCSINKHDSLSVDEKQHMARRLSLSKTSLSCNWCHKQLLPTHDYSDCLDKSHKDSMIMIRDQWWASPKESETSESHQLFTLLTTELARQCCDHEGFLVSQDGWWRNYLHFFHLKSVLICRPLSPYASIINLLKPAGYVMHLLVYHSRIARSAHTVLICFVCLRNDDDLCHLHHKLISFSNRVEKSWRRGTNWVL